MAAVARVDGLAAGKTFVLAVIEADAILAQFPAQVHVLVVDARGKIEQTDVEIFHHTAGFDDAFESRLNSLFELIAFEAAPGCFFVRNGKAAGAGNFFSQRADFIVDIRHFAARFHGFDQNRFELRTQALGFGQREIFGFFIRHETALQGSSSRFVSSGLKPHRELSDYGRS